MRQFVTAHQNDCGSIPIAEEINKLAAANPDWSIVSVMLASNRYSTKSLVLWKSDSGLRERIPFKDDRK